MSNQMTRQRAKELIDSLDDGALTDIATTASRKDLRLTAEMHLRRRYPSKKKARKARGQGATEEK